METDAEAAGRGNGCRLRAGEVEKLRAEKDQLIDRLARLQAEFDNARKRAEREKADVREYAVGNAVEPFLSVMDNFRSGAEGTRARPSSCGAGWS